MTRILENSGRNRLHLREPANPHLYTLLSHLKRIVMIWNCASMEARIYETTAEVTDSPSPVLYLGNLENIKWLERSLLQNYRQTSSRKISFPGSGITIKKCVSENTVAIVDINRTLAPFLPPGGLSSYPWIRQVVSLDSKEYRKHRYQLMGEFRRLMRKYSYATGLTSDPEDILHFYNNLYLPFVEYRFESMAHPRSFSEISKAVRKGFILQIFHENEWIAGDAVRISGDEIQGIASGLLPDYKRASRHNARAVMYPILFEWATSRGYNRINLLRSRANLEDGVFASKKHRGAVAEVDSWPHTRISFYVHPGTNLPDMWKAQLVELDGHLIPLGEALGDSRTC